jgi:hypothetical protein
MTAQELDALRSKMAEEPAETSSEIQKALLEVNALADTLAAARDVKKEIEGKLSNACAEVERLNQLIIDLLMASNLKSYDAPAGKLSVVGRFTAKLPVGPEKVALFDYLKSIGRFDDMASIHSATFTSWVQEQYALAEERGEGEPTLPGVSDVKTRMGISFRRS